MPTLFENIREFFSLEENLVKFVAQGPQQLARQAFVQEVARAGSRAGVQGFAQRQALAKKGVNMGFFDFIPKLIGGGIKLLGSALGVIPKVAAPVAAAVARRPVLSTAIAAGGVGLLGGGLLGGGGDGGGKPFLGGGIINPATGELGGVGGGNGMRTVVTQVITIDNATGQPVKVRSFLGAPFLMQKEVAHLKSSARKLMRGAARVPRRSAGEPTLNSQINRAVKHKVLHSVEQATSQALPA